MIINEFKSHFFKRLALGSAQFGLKYGIANEYGQVSPDEVRKILSVAADHKIHTLDTAIAYGGSERTLGQIGVTDWNIVTKLPAVPDRCTNIEQWIDHQISESLTRLGVTRLHAVLLHRPGQLLESQGKELLAALETLKHKGLTNKIGISVYSPDELERLFEKMNFDLVQAPLNILDRRFIDTGWTSRLRNMGVELHTRSTFLQGLLLMPASRRPVKFRRWDSLWFEWERWLNESGVTPLEACLRYVLSIEEIDKVIVGIDGLHQLHEILAATSGSLTSLPSWQQPIDSELISPAQWMHLQS